MQLIPNAKAQFIDSGGQPLANGSVGFYFPGTLNPKATFQDSAGTIANTNPVQLDSRGQALIWGTGVYRQILKDASGVTIWDQITEDPNSGLTGDLVDDVFVSGTDFTPGVTTQLTLTAGPGSIANTWIYFDGVYQDDAQATVNGVTLTFASPIPVGVGKVTVKIGTTVAIGTPGDGTVKDVTVAAGAGIQSSKLSFTNPSAHASTARTVQSKLSDVVSVTDYAPAGTLGLGVNSDYVAFNAAITNNPGKAIYVPDPPVNYVLDQTLTIPNNTTLFGDGKFSTKIFKSGNNDMLSIGDGVTLRDLWLDGQGATNIGGKGIQIGLISATDGHQNIIDCRVINFPDNCINYAATTAGSQSIVKNCEINQYNAATGSARFGVVIVDGAQLSAVPRTFIGCQFNGTPSFNFGGCNDLFISGCFTADLNYTLNSRGVQIVGTRISNQVALSLFGHNHSIVGCDVNPQITITPGADNIHIGPGSYNTLPVIDNSGNGRNQIFHFSQNYTPTFQSSGGGTAIGNGVLNGRWSRQGDLVNVEINMTVGSSTTIGAGDLQFTLPTPAPNNFDLDQICGSARIIRSTGTNYIAACNVPVGAQFVRMIRDTSGVVSGSSPASSAAGDSYSLSFSYKVGI